MRPAFSSTKQAAAFAGLLLLILLAPVLEDKKFLDSRRDDYAHQGYGNVPYPWIEQQIFEETNDIDIAFLGSSLVLNGINTPYVQSRLSEKLGRPAVVRSVAWTTGGYDMLYFVTQDLLAHRRVKLLVFDDELPHNGAHNNQLPFRFGENRGLWLDQGWHDRGIFYLSAILGMPNNLLSLCRPNWFDDDNDEFKNWKARLGSQSCEFGFKSSRWAAYGPFERFEPVTSTRSSDVLTYSPLTTNFFKFSPQPLETFQNYFCHRFAELLQTHTNLQAVMLYMPPPTNHLTAIPEKTFWPEIFKTRFALVGISPDRLYAGLSETEVIKLFQDSGHLNRNGQEYFTKIITPTLIDLHENAVSN